MMPDVKEVPGPSKEDNACLMCEYFFRNDRFSVWKS